MTAVVVNLYCVCSRSVNNVFPNQIQYFFRRSAYNLGKSLQDKLDRNMLREGLPMTKLRNAKTKPNATSFTP